MKTINVNIPELPYAAEEALNRLRVNVKFSGKEIKTIMIISSVPNEGKSHVAVYLWKMLAEAGFRTVLVDCDLRKSVMKKEMSFSCNEEYQGLDYYLSGLAEYEDVVHHTNIENGDIVPTTNILQNPSSLLEDTRLGELFRGLENNYDYVIVDSPPLVSVSDGMLIAQHCDGAILIVRSGETPKSLIRQSINQLKQTDCHLLGTVLNGVVTEKRAYGRYYGYYSKYYGEYYGKQENDRSQRYRG
jgi:capsular exopolysaccharide synthesis family protein